MSKSLRRGAAASAAAGCAEADTHSAIYEGVVRHRRHMAGGGEFEHSLALAYIDLDELPLLLGGSLVRSGPRLARFCRSDYLGRTGVLSESVRQAVVNSGLERPTGPIRVLAHLRTFGHCFNPVAFYYCFGEQGELGALLAEVTNTPWGERQTYALEATPGGGRLHAEHPKMLHVSPFMSMSQRYVWSASVPGASLTVHIENIEAGERVFDAALDLKRRPLSHASLRGMCVRYPAATVRVLALIYAHALSLRLRGTRVHPHPAGRGA